MLQSARRQGASIFIYLIFCLLIAIFVLNFGPQNGSQGGGCSGGTNVVVSVDGQEATQSSYHVAYANGYNRGTGKQKTYVALETIIRREILAQEAESRGMRVDSELIQDQIKKGWFFLGGQRVQITGIFDEDHIWNIKAFKSWYGSMNVSRNSYDGEQGRGLMASIMAEILRDSVQVSRDEALAHYLFENNTVQYDVVAFKPDAYRAAMKLTDADVARFLSTHAAEVETRYKTDERTYKGVKPQLQLRQIFIAKLEDEKPAAPPAPQPGAGSAAGSGAGSGSATAPAVAPPAPKTDDKKSAEKKIGMSIADATKKLEAARAAIAAGKQKFADAAKQLNTDEAMKASGGDLGWRTADNAMLGDKAVTDAVKALKPGEMTPVVATDRGVFLVLAESKREGDLSFDQVKGELAKEIAKDVWAKEAAKRAALAALDKARSGTGMNLDQLYEKEQAPSGPGIDMEQILNDPNLTQEQKQKLLQMMLQQQQKSGALEIESKDIPAAWYADADGAGGSSAPAPAASATTTPPETGAGSAPPPATTPKTGAGSATATTPAAGSATPAAGSGSATTGTTPVPATAPATAVEITPSTDTLPAFDTVKPPSVTRYGPAPRSPSMSGLGTSKEAVDALFDELSPGMLAKKVYEADGGYVLVQLISRSSPKVEEFEKEADRLVEELRTNRGQVFLEEWLKERCEKLLKDGRIQPNAALVRDFDDAGKPLPVTYRPCMSFQQ
jgi:parvulin-like peptidyl-prolyl isomerase